MNLIKAASTLLLAAPIFFLASCGDEKPAADQTINQTEIHGKEFKPGDIALSATLNKEWAVNGKNTYELKCQSCHKLTEERVVGPGWSGVTKRRQPDWIMNMITNVDVMLETDAEAQKLLEQCLVRMPNQNIEKNQALHLLEFMRENDGIK